MPLWQEAACHDDMPECASTRHYSSIHSRHPTRLLTATLGVPFASEGRGVAFLRAAGISHIATANSPWHSRIVQTARMFGVATDDTVLACDPVNGEYRQPLLKPAQSFHLVQNWPYDVFVAAWQQGITTRPILLGPVSFLALCGMTKEDNIGQGLMRLLLAYIECLEQKWPPFFGQGGKLSSGLNEDGFYGQGYAETVCGGVQVTGCPGGDPWGTDAGGVGVETWRASDDDRPMEAPGDRRHGKPFFW